MTSPANITPLRVDPTNAARQKAHRARRKATRNVTVPAASARPSLPWAVWPLGGTTVALMGVSLTHLSDGVQELTGIPVWQSWAMAIGIDAMLISVALALLTAELEVRRDISKVGQAMEVGTLAMSAGLNALAFSGGHFDLAHWPQLAFGCFVPTAISGATFILARLTRRAA